MKSKKALAIAALCLFTAGGVLAKLPPPTEEQKAKGEEAKAKAAEVAKKDAELLGKAQDRVAAYYLQQQQAKGVTVKPAPMVPAAPAGAPATASQPAKK